ncbi:aromatic acid decarboxylase, partial [Nostoc sp. HG1]|nr:aromatic acid decarboxylase [Nostoc sp. HG1]
MGHWALIISISPLSPPVPNPQSPVPSPQSPSPPNMP